MAIVEVTVSTSDVELHMNTRGCSGMCVITRFAFVALSIRRDPSTLKKMTESKQCLGISHIFVHGSMESQ